MSVYLVSFWLKWLGLPDIFSCFCPFDMSKIKVDEKYNCKNVIYFFAKSALLQIVSFIDLKSMDSNSSTGAPYFGSVFVFIIKNSQAVTLRYYVHVVSFGAISLFKAIATISSCSVGDEWRLTFGQKL